MELIYYCIYQKPFYFSVTKREMEIISLGPQKLADTDGENTLNRPQMITYYTVLRNNFFLRIVFTDQISKLSRSSSNVKFQAAYPI